MVTLHDTQQSRQTRYGLFDGLIAVPLLLIPIIVFWYVWSQYAVSVPKWDDHALKFFLFNLDADRSVSEKIYLFFQQHNEHRIVYDRFVTWLDFNLFGKLNYRHLMAIGNLSLIGLLVIFGLVLDQSVSIQKKKRSVGTLANGLFYLPPVAFLLLNLSHWENMFWGMAALQNFTVLLWVFWAIYVLAFSQKIWLAFLLATAATLTSGNGLLVWPIGFALLLVQLIFENRPYRNYLILWTIGAVGIVTLYFFNYRKPPGNPPSQGSFIDLTKGWLAFNGSAAEAFPTNVAFVQCLLFGGIVTAIVLVGWLYILEKGIIDKRLSSFGYFFVATTAFLLGTAATVAWSRVGFGINGLITSRYKLYSLLLLALVYSFAIIQQQKAGRIWTFCVGLAFSIALMGSSYLTYLAETIGLRHYLLTSQFNWTHGTNSPVVGTDSISGHYTTLSPAFYDDLPALYGPAQQPVVDLQITKTPDRYDIQNTTMPAQGLVDEGSYLLARSVKRPYLFLTRQNQQSVRKAIFRPDNLFTAGFQADISPTELDAGTYQLFILTVSDGNAKLYPTNQTIESTGPPVTTLKKNW